MASLAVSPEKESSSGGDDSFWNAWLPDSGSKATKKTKQTISSPSISSVETSEATLASTDRKSVSKVDALLESRRKAPDKLGLRKSKRKTSGEIEKEPALDKSPSELQKEESVTQSSDSSSSSFQTISLTEVSEISSTHSVEHTAVSASLSVETTPSNERTEWSSDGAETSKHGGIKSDLQETEGNVRNACDSDEVKGSLHVPESHTVDPESETAQKASEDTTAKRETEEANVENIDMAREESLPSKEAAAEVCVETSDTVVPVEDPVVDRGGEMLSEMKTLVSEDATSLSTSVIEPQEFDLAPTKLLMSLEDSSVLEEEEKSWCEELADVDLTLAKEKEETTEAAGLLEGSEAVESSEECATGGQTQTCDDSSDQTTVIPETDQGEEESCDSTPAEETMGESLSDSKSEGSVIEKTSMQVSSESGTTNSEEVDENNKTLTEDDFRKLATLGAESDGAVAQSEQTDGASIKSSPEHGVTAGSSPEHSGTASSSLTSSGYVKNMIEEAMVESLKESDSHSDRSSDKSSDMVRIESGMNSGHTSGDEIDTTTSSDIEIISTPTPNGEYKLMERPFDLSPLRHALRKTVRRGGSPLGHMRSDSGSSAQSNWSKNGDDLLSPEGAVSRPREVEIAHIPGRRRAGMIVIQNIVLSES